MATLNRRIILFHSILAFLFVAVAVVVALVAVAASWLGKEQSFNYISTAKCTQGTRSIRLGLAAQMPNGHAPTLNHLSL